MFVFLSFIVYINYTIMFIKKLFKNTDFKIRNSVDNFDSKTQVS